MPTKERKEREREQRARDQAMDAYVADAPTHIRQRLGHPSKLSDSLSTKGQHNAGWAKYDDETGHPLPREDPEDLGANSNRRDDREARALDFRERYPDDWGKRGGPLNIVTAEHRRRAERPKDEDPLDYPEPPSVGTIRRYMKDFPI